MESRHLVGGFASQSRPRKGLGW